MVGKAPRCADRDPAPRPASQRISADRRCRRRPARAPPAERALKPASGRRRACKTGMPRARASAITPAAPADVPITTSAWARASWRRERRPQRTGGDDPAIADAAPGIDDEQRKVLGKRRILKAVVHDDDARPAGDRHPRALDAVARHDGRRHARQQQRLVAHVERAMPRRIDPHRTRQPPAIAAGQEHRPFARMREHAAPPRARSASCRRRRPSDCRRRPPARRHAGRAPRAAVPATAP